VLLQDLANELRNMCKMLPMALKPGNEYHMTF
jgi:hypothetical protein